MDFDFSRYIAQRKSEIEQRAHNGATYSYNRERKLRRTLAGAKPVTLALEATQKLWHNQAKASLLKEAELVSDVAYPDVHNAAQNAAKTLGLSSPPIFICRAATGAHALGTDDDPTLFLTPHLATNASVDELAAIIGHQLGHVQNNHILYTTALYYLQHHAVFFVRWIVQPAVIALKTWSRRADITCDRAALLCCRDYPLTARGLVMMALAETQQEQVNEILAALHSAHSPAGNRSWLDSFGELFRAHPSLERRLRALEHFMRSRFYLHFIGQKSEGAPGSEEIDEVVAALLGGGKSTPAPPEEDRNEVAPTHGNEDSRP